MKGKFTLKPCLIFKFEAEKFIMLLAVFFYDKLPFTELTEIVFFLN